MLYGITQCYLPPGRGDIPAFTFTFTRKLVLDLATRESDARPSWLVTYGLWYNRPKTVTHPSTNRARRGLTSFMRQTPLTSTSRRQPNGGKQG